VRMSACCPAQFVYAGLRRHRWCTQERLTTLLLEGAAQTHRMQTRLHCSL
jgi:hypothetical protein